MYIFKTTFLFRIDLNKKYVNYLVLGLFYCFIFQPNTSWAQKIIKDEVFRTTIHTVQLYPINSPFLAPIVELNTADRLLLSFDDLSPSTPDLTYRLVHCNSNWQASNLSTSEYIQGYDSAPLNDYNNSINTLTDFTHFFLELPNDDMQFALSGNYVIEVYTDGNPENLVLTRRFRVFENLVDIQADIKRPVDHILKDKGQEIDIAINYPNFTIRDPHRNINLIIEQNQRTDNAITNLKPTFVHENQLEYLYDQENVFEAGKEFRRFNIQNIKFQTLEVEAIYYDSPLMHFRLNRCFSRLYEKYDYQEDLNGNYVVSIESVDDSQLEADYVWVHFSLEKSQPVAGGNVYVFGALSNWQVLPDYKMTYNYSKACYELALLVKQGFYNYIFAFYDEDKKQLNTELFEGNYYETENEYNIFVYHYDWDKDYDRLIGRKKINSVHKL